MLLGHWQEMKALGQAQDALAALAALLPDEADRVGADGEIETVPVDALRRGDVVLVRSGGRAPADGEITEGTAEFDESMITGESRPVARTVGDRVVAGTIATDSSVRLRIDAVGEETTLAGIQRLVAQAQASRSRAQVLADRAAALLFYVATAAAAVTFVAWVALGDTDEAVVRVVTVLVISCPHALGLATPLVTSLSSAMAARHGILIKDRLALEASRDVDAFLFDKTGTLTKGEHTVVGVATVRGPARTSCSASPARSSPTASTRWPGPSSPPPGTGARWPAATDFRSLTGRGVEAVVDGRPLRRRRPGAAAGAVPDRARGLTGWADGWRARGAAVLYLVRGDVVLGALALEDEIRPEAREAVADAAGPGPPGRDDHR